MISLKSKLTWTFLIVAFTLPIDNEGARILCIFPTPAKSHAIIHTAVASILADVGHNVTVIGTLPDVQKNAKYNYIYLEGLPNLMEISKELVNKKSFIFQLFTITAKVIQTTDDTMMHPRMQQFLKDAKKEEPYDLLIVAYLMNDFAVGLSVQLNCPIIFSFPIQSMYTADQLVGNPSEISYVPTIYSGKSQPMDFIGRVKNSLGHLIQQLFDLFYNQKIQRYYYQKYFPADQYPSYEEAKKNLALFFVNHHFSQKPIRPNVPAIIEIGGVQIKEKPDPLPEDIANVLDNAKNGVIYFSLGSIVQEETVPKEKSLTFFNVLSKLPYTVLFKWNEEHIVGSSPNIVYKSWLPQSDILAHPNVKLFITHGGLGGIVEAKYHGVPMVGMPLFNDQPFNVQNLVASGCGVSVDFNTLTEESFRTAVMEVLDNQKYTETARKFSTIYRDRPMTPRELVIYWSEYVIRHKGAKHMRSPVLDMNIFQSNSLDVYAFVFSVVGVVLFVTIKIIRFICCRHTKTASDTLSIKKTN